MGRKSVDDTLVLKAAYLFYEKHKTNSEIVKILNRDKATVSRLIKQAVDKGFVQVSNRISSNQFLELELLRKFGNKPYGIINIHIANASPIDDEVDKELVHDLAARLLESEIKDKDIVGVTCGKAVFGSISSMSGRRLRKRELTFIPFNSYYHWLNKTDPGTVDMIDSSAIALLAYAKFGADTKLKNSAYIFPTIQGSKEKENNLELYEKNPTVKVIKEKACQANVVVCGIGSYSAEAEKATSINSRHIFESVGLSSKEMMEAGGQGEINLMPYDKNGIPLKLILDSPNQLRKSLAQKLNKYYEHLYAISLEKIRELASDSNKRVIGVAYGEEKATAVFAALRGNLINVLVTDDSLARKLCTLFTEASGDSIKT